MKTIFSIILYVIFFQLTFSNTRMIFDEKYMRMVLEIAMDKRVHLKAISTHGDCIYPTDIR